MKRKNILSLLLIPVLALTACTGGSGTTSSIPSSQAAGGASTVSGGVASAAIPAVEPSRAYDVDAAVKAAGLSLHDDVSVCFPADAPGYLVNGGPYLVDAATVVRLTTARVEGTGSVKWIGYQIKSALSGARAFDGVIPVAKLNDPIYTCMNLPTEADYYECNLAADASWGPSSGGWNNRVNGFNMTPVDDTFNNILCMGAIFPALDEDRKPLLKADEELTLCIRNFVTLYHSTAAGRAWTVAQQTLAPPVSSVNHLYALPWSTHATRTLALSAITVGADHTEVKLKGSDFLGDGDKIDGYTYHYWDKKVFFSDLGLTGGQIDGFVLAATIWVKEPSAANKLVATIGADIRYNDEKGVETKGAQLNSSRAYLLPATPRVLVSHSVGPNSAYDAIVDSEAVQALLGLK